MLLCRYFHPDWGASWGIEIEGVLHDISPQFNSLGSWLQSSVGRVGEATAELRRAAEAAATRFDANLLDKSPLPNQPHLLAPLDDQEVWAAGVTYVRSRDARQEEAVDGGDVYERVYRAERPELFFKAHGAQVVPPGGQVGIRRDATWSVPEAELAVLLNPRMEVVGFTAGNDMSSRDIEGANPLYLPQAKIYQASCSLGRGIRLDHRRTWPEAGISMDIVRAGEVIFRGETATTEIRRTLSELVEHLGRCLPFPGGAVLLSGTGIVPPDDLSLQAGDTITIRIAGITDLTNTVMVV